jgi:tetratricopeptide (TPR) repeat protein
MLKETGFLFLLAIIFYRIIFKHKNIISIFVSGSVAFLLYITIRLGIGNADTAGHSGFAQISSLPLTSRVSSIPEIIYYYLKIIVYPVDLAINQQWVVNSVNFSTFYFPLLIDSVFFGVLFLIGFLVRKNKKNLSTFLFFALLFLMGLSLHLQIIPLDMTVSDRWFYLPFVGLLGMTGLVCTSIKLPGKNVRMFSYAIGFLLVILLSVRTIIRNTDWQNNITLYSHDLKISDNFQLEENLGYEYYLQNDFKKFLYYTDRSIKLLPNESNINNLALFYLSRGDIKKGQQYYREALTYDVYPKVGHISIMEGIYQGLTWSYIYSGQFEEARRTIQKAFSEGYTTGKLLEYLAISQYELQDQSNALSSSGKAKDMLQNAEANYVYNQIVNNQPIKLK